MKTFRVQKNTFRAQLLAVALSAAMSLCPAAETVVDYVSLNGGTAEGMLEDKYRNITSTFSDGKCQLIRETHTPSRQQPVISRGRPVF